MCMNIADSGFFTATNQAPFPFKNGGKNWCVCMWAANTHLATGGGKCDEIVLSATDKTYVCKQATDSGKDTSKLRSCLECDAAGGAKAGAKAVRFLEVEVGQGLQRN